MEINQLLGIFQNNAIEKVYFDQFFESSKEFLKRILLLMAILYAFFLIPDWFFLRPHADFVWAFLNRSLFVGLMVILYLWLRFGTGFTLYPIIMLLTEIAVSLLFVQMFVVYQKSGDLMIQFLGMICIILGIFLIPNSAVYHLISTGISGLAFVFHAVSMYQPAGYQAVAWFLYIGIIIGLSYINAVRGNIYQRKQYVNSLNLKQMLDMDPLTEIYNRQKFDDELMKYLASIEDERVATIMFDIDNFKKVNDEFGHMEGDRVLKKVSEIARSMVREKDILARWGGEEFIILMPYAGKLEAYSVAERIRIEIEKEFMAENRVVTCSFGVTEISRDDNFEVIMKRVDSYLYEAKAKGKNHTMVY
ncbi:hypothetical protein SANA_32390 [Gottschalkiaceae bacterium SANA]|nr:hypothetical protein SANA_32390 [Gottschalkiaceae bacterium SANA]